MRDNDPASKERQQGAKRFSPSKSSQGRLFRNDFSAYHGTPAQPQPHAKGAARRDPRRGESPGVRCQTQFSLTAHAWGSSVECRQAKSQKRIKGRSISKIGRPFCKRSEHMNTRIDYCGVILLLRNLLSSGAFSRQEIEKIARRVAAESGADLIISL